MALNHLSAADVIFPGQRLLLPGPAPAAPATPTHPARTAAGAIAAPALRTSVRQAADANRAAVLRPSRTRCRRDRGPRRATAQRFGVDPALAVAVAVQESGLNQQKVSSANAIGVMQVVPSSGRWASTLVGRDLNLLDTRDNVVAGVAILSSLTASAPGQTAIAGYYQGLGSVRRTGCSRTPAATSPTSSPCAGGSVTGVCAFGRTLPAGDAAARAGTCAAASRHPPRSCRCR